MKRLSRFLSIFLAFSFFLSACKPALKMQEFKSGPGGFSVQVPPDVEFTETTQEIDSGNPDVGILSLHNYFMSITGEDVYQIFYYDYPVELASNPDVSEDLLNGARDGWLNTVNGLLIEQETELSLGNFPGREMVVEASIDNQDMKIKARYFLVGNRIYQIMVGVPKDGEFTAAMEAFLRSFALP